MGATPTSSPTFTATVTSSPTSIPTPTLSIEQRVGNLETQASDLAKKVEVRPKDMWDKASAVSGIIVAIVGGVATYVYQQQQRANERIRQESEARLKNKELAISQSLLVKELLPSLRSKEEREVKAALLAIAAIDKDLGTELATLFGGAAGVSALDQIATNPSSSHEQQSAARERRDQAEKKLKERLRRIARQAGVPDQDLDKFVDERFSDMIMELEADRRQEL